MSKMKWLKGLFGTSEDPHRKYDGASGNDAYRLPNIFEGPERNEDYNGSSSKANEELDRAIALSLTEEELRRKSTEGDTQAQSDEELARALQASLDLDNRPREPFDFGFLSPFFDGPTSSGPPVPTARSQPICAGCNLPLGTGRFLSCMGAQWHPRCFRCTACYEPITDHEFSVQGEEPYHKRCYKELFHPKCEVCHNFIPTNRAGLIEYRSHPFWQLKYCPSHERDRTPRCGSCDRIQPRDQTYVDLDDGRKLCLECLDSVIMDTKECQPLYYNVLKFYKHLGMNIEQEIPMLLVERQALNAAREGESHGHRHTPETRGLCLSEEQIITSVYRKPSKSRGNKPFMVRTESQKLVRHCEVTAILVLYGLPRELVDTVKFVNSKLHLELTEVADVPGNVLACLFIKLLTGSILAHELMHAWLRLDGGFPNLEPEVEEGICQVMAHMWLLAQTGYSGSSSTDDIKRGNQVDQMRLGEFFRHQIAHDPSPVYGGGFRAGQIAVGRYGLPRTLEHIKMTGTFPL